MSLLVAAIVLLPFYPGTELARLNKQVRSLGWTHDGHVLIVTKDRVLEVGSGRSKALPNIPDGWNEALYAFGAGSPLRFSADGRRALGPGFVLDIQTLTTEPLELAAIWEGNRLTAYTLGEHSALYRRGVRTRIARGWYVTGLSSDARYAFATKKPPFDGDTTYLLSIDSRTGAARVLRRYENSSDDHVMLSAIERQPRGSRFLAHKVQAAAPIPSPFWAESRLVPIEFPRPKDVFGWDGVEWLDGRWLSVDRHFGFENTTVGPDIRGFTADAIDLWRLGSRESIRLVKVTHFWKWDGRSPVDSGGPVLGCRAIDWRRKKLVYAVNTIRGGAVYVIDFRTQVRDR